MIAYFPVEKVSIAGEASEYTRPTDNGSQYTSGFCPKCGSTVYGKTARIPGILGLTVGTIDDAAPQARISVYEQSRHDWIDIPEGVARHPRGTDS